MVKLETLLEEAKKEIREKQHWIDMFHDLQYRQGERIRQKSRENKRVQKENASLRQEVIQAKVADKVAATVSSKTTMMVKDLHDQELDLPLCCPISMDLFKDEEWPKDVG